MNKPKFVLAYYRDSLLMGRFQNHLYSWDRPLTDDEKSIYDSMKVKQLESGE